MYVTNYQARLAFFISSSMCFPIWAGDEETTIPASVKAFILLGASPFPSELYYFYFER